MLGKLSMPGRPTDLILVGQGPIVLAVSACGIVWTFFLSSIFSFSFFLSGRRPDIDCLKGPLNPKQPTNQLTCQV